MVGISHARAYVIWRRYTTERERAFDLRSSQPYRSADRTLVRTERRIERARGVGAGAPYDSSRLLGIACSRIHAVLRRMGLSRWRDLDARR